MNYEFAKNRKVKTAMAHEVSAEIIAIGTELLLGEITDTNSVFIARGLRDIGVNVFFMTTVGDNEHRITDAIRIAMSRADVVITCGGLGPTIDDMTRQAVAKATHRELVFHEKLLDAIAMRFSGFRTQMPENNRRQAYVPDQAIIIENAVGTAPSFAVRHEGHVVLSLPGVPREMKYLFTQEVIPLLQKEYGLSGTVIKARVLKTAGIGESALDELIGDKLLQASNPTVGLAAHSGQVDVRITAKADSHEIASAMIADVEEQLRQRMNKFIFGVDSDTIESALGTALAEHNTQLIVVEVGMPPAQHQKLSSSPVIHEHLGEPHHFHTIADLSEVIAFSEASSVREMAEQTARHFAQTAGEKHPVITFMSLSSSQEDAADSAEMSAVAVSYGGKTRSRSFGFSGGNDYANAWTSLWGLASTWRMLKEQAEIEPHE